MTFIVHLYTNSRIYVLTSVVCYVQCGLENLEEIQSKTFTVISFSNELTRAWFAGSPTKDVIAISSFVISVVF